MSPHAGSGGRVATPEVAPEGTLTAARAANGGYLSGVDHNAWKSLYEQMKRTFTRASEQRHDHPEPHAVVDGVDGLGRVTPQMYFVDFEMRAMHAEVNRLRAEGGVPPLPLSAVALVEGLASGHVDYYAKYPLYCADLVAFGTTFR